MEATAFPDVLAVGAWLKNTACRLGADGPRMSPVHGDLSDPEACRALEGSLRRLLDDAAQPVRAVAHDLHPDFFSTRLAFQLAAELGVPAVGVQHHHAHIAAVMAEFRVDGPVIGLALDGVGLGTDQQAWGGELLQVSPQAWTRLGHLHPLALPGGDLAAREPWRMAASALHAMGRGDEVPTRFAAVVGLGAVQGVRRMLDQRLNCPPSSSTGRWFDAAAGALGLSVRQSQEAEAAMALEQAAVRGLAADPGLRPEQDAGLGADGVLDLRPLLSALFDARADGVDRAAAAFHLSLAQALGRWATLAARQHSVDTVCLGGGCFFNAVLSRELTQNLEACGLKVLRPQHYSCGDAGLALGQAWVVAQQLRHGVSSVPPLSPLAPTAALASLARLSPIAPLEGLPCA